MQNSFLPTLLDITRLSVHPSSRPLELPSVDNTHEWSQLLRQIELYGLSNLFMRLVSQHDWAVPAQVAMGLRALAMRHRAAADARYQLMSDLLPEFSAAGIPVVALKGLALAPMIFASDEMRPMRDIDILVPREKLLQAGALLKHMGFKMPDEQPSKFMRDAHQLPNATKEINGFTISVEVHHDAISRDAPGHLFFNDIESQLQEVQWRELTLMAPGHEHMLHQVSRHLATLHPGAVLKMINVLDVVLYAEKYQDEINWPLLRSQYSHVINTLKCLHLIVPLTERLQARVGSISNLPVRGTGETPLSLTRILSANASIVSRLKMLLLPPDWWLHLYYNVAPEKSLIMTKSLRHPLTVVHWFIQRAVSRLKGG